MEKSRVLTYARHGWSLANTVIDDPRSSKREKELAQALVSVAYAVVELAGGND